MMQDLLRGVPTHLMDAGGDPVPSPSVVARLQQLSPRFGLRWVNGPLGYFALTVRWAPEDPRWEHVRTGALPEHMAFDLEHTFPRTVAVDEIASYVEARWASGAASRAGRPCGTPATSSKPHGTGKPQQRRRPSNGRTNARWSVMSARVGTTCASPRGPTNRRR